jgi:hypothetical protein
MNMRQKAIYFLILLFLALAGHAQHASDTAAAIRQLDKVMSFATQPYLYYNTVTTLRYGPMAGGRDSGSTLHSRFFKVGDDLYYGNEVEETFLQDSLLIRVNHNRKAIILSKVDITTKKNLDLLPLSRQTVRKMFRQQFTISQPETEGDTGRIVMHSHERMVMRALAGTDIEVLYDKATSLPTLLKTTYRIRQEPSEEMVSTLQNRGYDMTKMATEDNGGKSLIITETAAIRFYSIGMEKDKAMTMPSWKEEILFDNASGTFMGKGACAGYEVMKTF